MVSQWRPYKVTVNRQGLRSASDTEPGAVLAVGDSFTFGVYLDNEDTWPVQLERFIARRNPDRIIPVGNAGIAGYGIVQQLAYLKEKGLVLKPRLVILAFNPNDIETDMWPERLARMRRPRDETGVRSLLRHSAAVTWVNSLGVDWQRRRAAASASPTRETSERDYQAYATEFRALVSAVRGSGARLSVVAFPLVKQLVADGCGDAPQRFVERLSRDTETPFLDLAPEFRRHRIEDLYLLDYDARRPLQTGACFSERHRFVGNTHPARYGYAVAARAIGDWLVSAGLL